MPDERDFVNLQPLIAPMLGTVSFWMIRPCPRFQEAPVRIGNFTCTIELLRSLLRSSQVFAHPKAYSKQE